jgi:RimJ/RimL family protein N-acetyltransferase
MEISLIRYAGEEKALAAFLTGEVWTFHGTANLSEQWVREGLQTGRFEGEHTVTFWIADGERRIGLLRLFDLEDNSPVFDLRISEAKRGKGYGSEALRRMADYVFGTYPDKERFEGHTRIDNVAMRKAFVKAGFVKEGVHRRSWPSQDGKIFDSVGYAIIREDWAEKKVTPVVWDDLPY